MLLIAYIGFSHLLKNKEKIEDNRLTKGLQLLQNKISILQDLSDKTDEQVRKWVHLIEQKSTEVRSQLIKSDEKIIQIESALSKALDVSKIFYDQVPHAEMTERQKTSKYVQAAKLANQGFSTDQISQKIDLSTAEIELIIKMNREELQFSEKNLPAWVQTTNNNADNKSDDSNSNPEYSEYLKRELIDFTTKMQQIQQTQKINQLVTATAFDANKPDMTSMNQIKTEFSAMLNDKLNDVTDTLAQNSTQVPQTFIAEVKNEGITKTESGQIVRPFTFRKIVKIK